jgi:23S rRNA (uridine2552-2'-O)-methyltransferase
MQKKIICEMPYNPQDYYFKKAKAEHFAARSVYKLQEINERYKIFKKGQKVLDLGAAPGSWSQYVAAQVGHKGSVIGIDLKPVNLTLANATFIEADIFRVDWENLWTSLQILPPFDAVISDMAPQTTGVSLTDHARSVELCSKALSIAELYLQKKGIFICKMFDGQDFIQYHNQVKKLFDKVQILRPQSTRKESKELFFICLGYK